MKKIYLMLFALLALAACKNPSAKELLDYQDKCTEYCKNAEDTRSVIAECLNIQHGVRFGCLYTYDTLKQGIVLTYPSKDSIKILRKGLKAMEKALPAILDQTEEKYDGLGGISKMFWRDITDTKKDAENMAKEAREKLNEQYELFKHPDNVSVSEYKKKVKEYQYWRRQHAFFR